MKDRISKHPNRVQLIPVAGQANVFDLVRADEPIEVGTPLNKANLLADDTASLLGLDSTATLDDFLKNVMLGGFKGFWWKKYSATTDFTTETFNSNNVQMSSVGYLYDKYFDMYYADSYEIRADGFAHLVNPTKISYSYNDTSALSVLKGKYFLNFDQYSDETDLYARTVWYGNDNISVYTDVTSNIYYVYLKNITEFSEIALIKELTDYVCSSDINAYPNGDYGEDGYYYELDKSVAVDKVYRWKKGLKTVVGEESVETVNLSGTYDALFTMSNNSGGLYLYYADEYETYIDGDGQAQFRLINPIKYAVSTVGYGENTQYATFLEGKYVMRGYMDTGDSIMWYINTGNGTGLMLYSNTAFVALRASKYKKYNVSAKTEITNPSIVTSINENEYPSNDYGEDGYYYSDRETINLGGAKVASGSYVGTGTYGSSNPNSLTFDFVPKLVFVQRKTAASNTIIMINGCELGWFWNSSSNTSALSWNDKTVSWYNPSSATYQCNIAEQAYYYLAIG